MNWRERYPMDTDPIEDVPAFVAYAGCLLAGEWFERQDDGPYTVYSVGEAGVERVEFSGFHYPYQALAAEEIARKRNPRCAVFSVNNDDPESSVERQDEAYHA